MDVNQALYEARTAMDNYASAAQWNNRSGMENAASDALRQLAKLDAHLSAGGAPPEAWCEGPDAPGEDGDRIGVSFTRDQIEAWVGFPLSDHQVIDLEETLPNSSLPDCVAAVATEALGFATLSAENDGETYWIVTDHHDNQLAGPYDSEEEAEESAENLLVIGHAVAQVASVS